MTPVVTKETCRNLDAALRHEWLDTNGLGGYASSTIHNCNTRKYHGLLVASLTEPAGRFVLLSKFDDTLVTATGDHPLSCNRFPGAIHPHGHLHLIEFKNEEGPVFLYQAGAVILRKRILMVRGENTVLVRYEAVSAPGPVTLRLNPLLSFRRHHELKHEDSCIRKATTLAGNGFVIHPYEGMPSLYIQCDRAVSFEAIPNWYHRFEYEREAERGYDFREDCFCPGTLDFTLAPGETAVVAASVSPQSDPAIAWNHELVARRLDLQADEATARLAGDNEFAARLPGLIHSGRVFPTRTPGAGRATVIAGYPWFDDWGRDTLISLPGLTFYSGRPELGAEILVAVAPHERDGLIPNCFAADPEQHAYNSVDASLWYFWAVQQYVDCTGDHNTIRLMLWPTLKRILAKFMAGTHYQVFMTPDGLLHAGGPNTQLTWMDATSNGQPVTPRHGYAVELNALWYNALCFCEKLATDFHEAVPWPADLTARLARAFSLTFWMEHEGCLADTLANNMTDRSIRPNQIFAASLPFSPLDEARRKRVVETVRRELLTPYGLRTLSPRDPAYRGRYEGDQPSRDATYHQGTVWPWLLGHYGEALLRTADDPKAAALDLLETLRPLLSYSLDGPGLGNVPEIFDGDNPQRPNGCPAQAWSSAELIRLFTLCAKACSR